MILLVGNMTFTCLCSLKVPPTRAKSPKFTRRRSCSDAPPTPEAANTTAASSRSHRHSIANPKDANRVQCSPKNGVAAKTRAVKPVSWRPSGDSRSAKCCECRCTNLTLAVSRFHGILHLIYTSCHQKKATVPRPVCLQLNPFISFLLFALLCKNSVAGTMYCVPCCKWSRVSVRTQKEDTLPF